MIECPVLSAFIMKSALLTTQSTINCWIKLILFNTLGRFFFLLLLLFFFCYMYFVQLHFKSVSLFCIYKQAAASENQLSAKPKAQISYAVTAQLISTFVFVTRILQFLFYLNPQFQASILHLWLYLFVSDLVGNPYYCFSHKAADSLAQVSSSSGSMNK